MLEPADPRQLRQAANLHAILLSVFVVYSIGLAIGVPFVFARKLEGAVLLILVLATASVSWWCMRRGRVAQGCHLIAWVSWLLCAAVVLLSAQVHNAAIFVAPIFIAAALLGPWPATLGAVAGVAVSLFGVHAAALGVPVPKIFPSPPNSQAFVFAMQLVLGISAFFIILRRLERALRRSDADLAERMRVEQALRESEQRLNLALAAARIGIWEWQVPNGRLIATPQAEQIFGLRPAEFGGTYEDFLRLVHEGDRDRVVQFNLGILEGRVRARAIEHRIVQPDGSIAWVESKGVLHRNPAGEPLRVIGTVSDVTRRKLAEQGLQALNAELEQRVRERTRDLEHTNRELESFSYSVSHDLRGSLRRIEGFTRILALQHGHRLDPEAGSLLAKVRNLTQHMGRLIDDLLKLARVNRQELVLSEVDLSAIARETIAGLAAADAGRRVEAAIATGLIAAGDPGLLRVVLDNLIGNAWKFTARAAGARIEFGAAQANGQQAYYVRDNGAGFDMAHAANLFGAFQRLHRRDEFEGTGIGLATVHRVISRHGGAVWADSAPGAGATFYFTLPGAR